VKCGTGGFHARRRARREEGTGGSHRS
jgi:hypothetical protein